jgi:hypothetical protein
MRALMVWIAAAIAAEPVGEMWIGHAIVAGKRAVPLLGKVEARTESWVLARVLRSKDGFQLEQRSCAVELSNPLGVRLFMNPGAAEKLPVIRLQYSRRADGRYYQMPATSGWGSEDVDRDGQPGLTVNLEAPICGGRLFVGVRTKSLSRGTVEADGSMIGELRAQIDQRVLGTEGACISVLADDSTESAAGTFAYVPTSTAATCATYSRDRWPVRAKEP